MRLSHVRFAARCFIATGFLGCVFASASELGPKSKESVFYEAKVSKMEAGVQAQLPEFRFITQQEVFEKRKKAKSKVQIQSNPMGAIATLHDPKTGKPLESCQTPCTLHMGGGKEKLLILYKYGYSPKSIIASTTFFKRMQEPFYLGQNQIEVEKKIAACFGKINDVTEVNTDAEICVRFPPMMPPRAERSGHCIVVFDVTPKGLLENTQIKSCSEKTFAANSLASVKNWIYAPKIEGGQAVTQTGVEATITYHLTNGKGKVIPEKK